MGFGYPCAAMDSLGCCTLTDDIMYPEGEHPNGADEQGVCMDCRSLEECEEYDENDLEEFEGEGWDE